MTTKLPTLEASTKKSLVFAGMFMLMLTNEVVLCFMPSRWP